MQPVVWSFLGACVALIVRFFVDKHERKMQKRRDCLHLNCRIEVAFGTYKTRICNDCGYQEPIKEGK